MNNGNLGDFESFEDFDSDKKIKHPVVTFFHLVFRFLAILVYIFGGFSSFIGCFVSVVLLLSLDFWTVKNITGRIMVGLRWWNYVDDNGDSQWVFEAGVRTGPEAAHRLSSTESKIFWMGLISAPLLWVLLFLVAIFRFNFKWLVLVIIGVSLTGSNLLGYLRCKMGKTDISGAASGVANSYMRKAMLDNLMGIFKSTPVNSTSTTNLTV